MGWNVRPPISTVTIPFWTPPCIRRETLESIVPDACPDILRIVDTEAVVCLKSKKKPRRGGSRWPEPPGAPSSTSPMAPKGSGG